MCMGDMQTVVRQPGTTELYLNVNQPPAQHFTRQYPYRVPSRTQSGIPFSSSFHGRVPESQSIQFSEVPGVYYFEPTEPLYGTRDSFYHRSWTECCLQSFCCCFDVTEGTADGFKQPPFDVPDHSSGKMPWSFQKRPNHEPMGDRVGGLTNEVYQKIKEVDNQTSTLTAAGTQGLSARVLDSIEYREYLPDGTPETFVCQTVELIKRPGQSLGLFLREGNGLDRYDGVFVSRLSDDSELTKHREVIAQMDEIITVNNVDVTHMGIDEVVVIMSIPRRLVLRIRYVKSRRELAGGTEPGASGARQKPIVIVKRLQEPEEKGSTKDGAPEGSGMHREDSVESGLTDDPTSGPTPTAKTSLGLRARQQLAEIQGASQHALTNPAANERTRLLRQFQQESGSSYVDVATSKSNQYDSTGQKPTDVSPGIQRRSNSDRRLHGAPARQQFALYNPRVLDSAGQPMPSTSAHHDPHQQRQGAGTDTVAFTARMPPPKLGGHTIRRTESLRDPLLGISADISGRFGPPQLSRDPMGGTLFSPRSVASDSVADYQQAFENYAQFFPHTAASMHQPPPLQMSNSVYSARTGPPPLAPKPVLRQPSVFPPYSTGPVGGGSKANSLPRRRPGARTVKWKNDLVGSSGMMQPGGVPGDMSTDSEGAASAPEFPLSPSMPPYSSVIQRQWDPSGFPDGIAAGAGVPQMTESAVRTVDDIFSAQEYRAWAGRGAPYGSKARSSSLPPRGVLADLSQGAPGQRFSIPPAAPLNTPYPSAAVDQRAYARLDVSPLLSRRPPLRPMGAGVDIDDGPPPYHTGLLTAMTGLLVVHILEGRGLKIPERQREWTDEMYCVLEIDGEHRARTGVNTCAQRFRWNETFEIDVTDARQMDIYVYSWHPQLRQKLCHRGSLKLMEAFVIDRMNGERRFALNLEPRGQLLVRVNFAPLPALFRRALALRRSAYFGVDLATLVEREATGLEVPVLLRRVVDEVERRGVDTTGIYCLTGAAEKKKELRHQLEKAPLTADLSADATPDTNVLTAVLKDFLRELPEPLVPGCIFQMLVDAWRVCLPNDREGNARLMLGVVDCMPRIQKCTLMVLMDHFKCVTAQAPHSGMNAAKLSRLFGPLLFCAANPSAAVPPEVAASAAAAGLPPPSADVRKSRHFLDVRLAADVLAYLQDLWPGRNSSSESSGSDNSTINLTDNGAVPLMNIWMQERRFPESNC